MRQRLRVRHDAEKRAERVERVESPVETEGVLIQVGRAMLWRDSVVDAIQPCLQVAENKVD